jgi:hypothetical protein
MNKRWWRIKCPKCEKSVDLSVGNFRLIPTVDFAQKPQFHCLKCDQLCDVELKVEGESK